MEDMSIIRKQVKALNKKPSNADKIRSMTDEELARWIADELIEPGYYAKGQAYELWLDWLRQEVPESDG